MGGDARARSRDTGVHSRDGEPSPPECLPESAASALGCHSWLQGRWEAPKHQERHVSGEGSYGPGVNFTVNCLM